MAKPIIVSFGGVQSNFDHEKLDRAKLYGRRQRQVLDPEGQRCEKAELTRDGTLLVRSGMTAQGYFDDGGTWVPNNKLVGLDEKGNPVPLQPSTLGEAQPLSGPVAPTELLDLAVRSVYALSPEGLDPKLEAELKAGKIYKFTFNYRADYTPEVAFLVGNASGYFALVGEPSESDWLELQTVVTEVADEADDEEELDFEMF
ncbi:MAG: hypothetical protein JNK56_37255 [Myxococcales bacterium]|nr:hypothetical protein [Myxococcales bacterium]